MICTSSEGFEDTLFSLAWVRQWEPRWLLIYRHQTGHFSLRTAANHIPNVKVQNLRDLETLTYRTGNFLNKAISRQNWKWPHIMLLMCVVESHTTMGVQISPYLLRPVDAQSFRLAEQSHVVILYPQRISLIRSIAEPKTSGCGINCQIRQGKYCSKTTLTSTDTS